MLNYLYIPILKNILFILCGINLIIDFINSIFIKEEKEEEKNNSNKDEKLTYILFFDILILINCILFFIFLIYIISKIKLFGKLFFIYLIIMIISLILISIVNVHSIFKKSINDKLTNIERKSLIILPFFLLEVLPKMCIAEKCLNSVCDNKLVYEIFLITTYTINYFFFIFFICSSAILIIKSTINFIKSDDKLEIIRNKLFINTENEFFCLNFKYSKKCIERKKLYLLLTPIAYIFDTIKIWTSMFLLLIVMGWNVSVSTLLILVSSIINIINYEIINKYEVDLVITIFRFSLILAVIVSYFLICYNKLVSEQLCDLYSFVCSVIVIPVVLEKLLSRKNK